MEVKKIYFDMDGVLADFGGGLRELCGMEPFENQDLPDEVEQVMWDAIRNCPEFYSSLKLVEGSGELFAEMRGKYGDKVEVLTGIPGQRRRLKNVKEDKVDWAHRLLDPELVVNTVNRSEKPDFVSGEDCILIDDYQDNIDLWVEAGGTGILFKSAAQARRALENLGVL